MKFRCWRCWALVGDWAFVPREIGFAWGDENCWLACDYEPWLGKVMPRVGKTDINAFGYSYSMGSVCNNSYVSKLGNITVVTYTPHRVRVSKGINVSFPDTGHNFPQPRFIIAGESTIFISPSKAYFPGYESSISNESSTSPTTEFHPQLSLFLQVNGVSLPLNCPP